MKGSRENNPKMTSRRKFVKGIGGGALATAAAVGFPAVGCQSQAARPDWSATYDWISVGSGVAGCAGAIAGHDRGFKTLLVEKTDKIGGDTAQSGGFLWVPMNSFQNGEGVHDSREDALNYLRYVGGGYSVPEYMEALVDNASRVLDHFRQKADCRFRLARRGEFYYPIAPGSKELGRLVLVEPFPAQTLGDWRSKVHLSIYTRGLIEALEGKEGDDSTEQFGPARSDEKKIALWRKVLGDGKVDALLKRDEEQRVGGAGLIAYLFRAVLQRGIEVRTETAAERLIEEGGRVVGLEINQNGKREQIRATRGILLAMGGAENGRGGHGPNWMIPAGSGGEIYSHAYPVPMCTLHAPGENFPNGAPLGRPNTEVQMTHSLVVNRFGERFADESFFQSFGTRLNAFDTLGEHRYRNVPCYLIFDRNSLEKNFFAGLPPGSTELLDWVAQGKTLADVARQLKLPAAKLEAAVARFNEQVRRGKDLDFGRKPRTLGAIEKPPFFGVELTSADPFLGGTKVGMDPKGQVLHYATGKPIPGLYASGALVATSRIWGIGYQAGYSLMSGMTFGFLAAEHAAAATA